LPVKNKKILSEDFIRRIVEFSAGYFRENELTNLFSLIEAEAGKYLFTHSSESNLLRVIGGTYDKVSFLSDCLKYPHYIELLITITSNSNYLTDILVRNPEYFYWIANPSNLEKELDDDDYPRLVLSAVKVFRSFETQLNALRRLKRKEILRIGAKDIFLKKDFEVVTRELSSLAKAIAARLFSICYTQILNKYKLDLPEDRYCMVSLGKLGGKELNYSSDIDLIFFYDENELLPVKKEFQEILNETIILFINSASGITDAGYIYRTDFRLRPDGKNSPLCKSLSDYLMYYEIRGEDWERQMLIKCDFLAGNEELYSKFKKYLIPFIFPSSFNNSPLDQIKKFNKESKSGDKNNIKLAPGGIRDIEFSVQALQLLNGGRIKSLRNGNTLLALNELQKHNLLSENEAEILKKSYILYRKIEHYLQLMNDTQTHSIPSEGEIRDKLSFFLGYNDMKAFLEKVESNQKKVRKIYNSITGTDKKEKLKPGTANVNFSNPQAAEKDLVYLREGKGLLGQKEFDYRSMQAFDKIYELLIIYLQKSVNPDLVLKNFARIIRQAKFPSIWYEEFRDKKFFRAFLTICEFSQASVDIFAEDKKLRELFLSKKVFQKISLSENYEYNAFSFLLYVQFSLGIINSRNISGLLSEYFARRIKGLSASLNEYDFLNNHYFIGVMGSAGSGEMTFASDIDLIFITDNLEKHYEEQNIFLEFLDGLRNKFKPVKIDCRLRPEGQSAMLVWDLNSYINYIYSRARSWELQAFTKLCFVAGNKNLFNQVIGAIIKRLKTESHNTLKTDLLEMRRKLLPSSEGISGIINLKKNRGSIMDIEFILQYLILCNPQFFQKCRAKNNRRILNDMIKHNPGLEEPLNILSINYEFIKSLLLQNQNIFNQSSSIITKDELKLSILAYRLNSGSAKNLEKRLNKTFKETYSIFAKIFGIQL
jgi:glutamate-ammonia-ligase adenylyltransferase